MHLTPKEIDKLMLLSLGAIAARRKEKGLKLNYPEAVAYISSAALEGAREGKTLEQVMTDSTKVLTKNDVMEVDVSCLLMEMDCRCWRILPKRSERLLAVSPTTCPEKIFPTVFWITFASFSP